MATIGEYSRKLTICSSSIVPFPISSSNHNAIHFLHLDCGPCACTVYDMTEGMWNKIPSLFGYDIPSSTHRDHSAHTKKKRSIAKEKTNGESIRKIEIFP